MDKKLEILQKERDRVRRKYGQQSAAMANEVIFDQTDAISTGWLMLDYALGTGGFKRRHLTEVFGKNDIGKSTLIAHNILRNALKQDLLCGYVALEPSVDPDRMEQNGVDTERVLLVYPDHGLEAFEICHDWVTGKDTGGVPVLDYIIFDSIGAVNREDEAEKGTPSAFGASNLITAATRALLMPCYKNNVGVLFLNQVRVDTKARVAGVYDSPGGEALKHNVMQRVQLRPGGSSFKEKIDGQDVEIGRPLIASIKRNKLAEGTGQVATCDFYSTATDDHPLGIDVTKDIIDTAMMTGVFSKSGSWYTHPSFPADKKGEHKLQGAPAINTFIQDHPEAIEKIRQDVMNIMAKRVAEAAKRKREAKKK